MTSTAASVGQTSTTLECRCDGGTLERFLRIPSVPVLITRRFPDPDEARAVPRGVLDLGFCDRCGLIRNMAFEPSLIRYYGDYENSQMFSGVFRDYARALARSLVERYALGDGRVLEVGCGQAEFLEVMVGEGLASAVGFDPAYRGPDVIGDGRIRLVTDIYDERYAHEPVDLVVCRHVLEHCDDPGALLGSVRATIGDRDAAVYFEVPNATFVLSESGMWDLIYQHVSYFTEPSLRSLFAASGYQVDRVTPVFGGQFLAVEARPVGPRVRGRSDRRPTLDDGGALRRQVDGFVALWEAAMRRWQDVAERWRDEGDDAVLWGGGAKGLTFLNLTPAGEVVSRVVDVNPRKWGAFVPPAGQPVVPPAALRDRPAGRVVVANKAYQDEIRDALDDLGLRPTMVVL